MKTTSPERVVVMPEPGKIFLGGGGGGDLLSFSDSCLPMLTAGAGLGTVLEGLSSTGLAGFSSVVLGNFSGPFLSDGGSIRGFSFPKNNRYRTKSYTVLLQSDFVLTASYLYLKLSPLGCGC